MSAKRNSGAGTWDLPLQNSSNLLRGAGDWWEMMFASATTIGFRLSGIQDNFNRNRRPDTAELSRMITEKNIAWWQAGLALLEWQAALIKLYSQLATQEWVRVAPTTLSAAVGGAQQYAAWPSRLAEVSLQGMADVMKPYHTKSLANARRLSNKSGKR